MEEFWGGEEFPFKKGAIRCGHDLEKWLTNRGLSLLSAKDIIIGIPDFKSTTLAFDVDRRIIDYDQYYQDVDYVKTYHYTAIADRIRHKQKGKALPYRLIFFTNVPPDCLAYNDWGIL